MSAHMPYKAGKERSLFVKCFTGPGKELLHPGHLSLVARVVWQSKFHVGSLCPDASAEGKPPCLTAGT